MIEVVVRERRWELRAQDGRYVEQYWPSEVEAQAAFALYGSPLGVHVAESYPVERVLREQASDQRVDPLREILQHHLVGVGQHHSVRGGSTLVLQIASGEAANAVAAKLLEIVEQRGGIT